MPRYVAFLRVSPLNAKMPEIKRCFESAGFTEVRTLLSCGLARACAARLRFVLPDPPNTGAFQGPGGIGVCACVDCKTA